MLRLLQKIPTFPSPSLSSFPLIHLRSPYSHSSQMEKEKKMDSEYLSFENLGTEDLAWAVENANANANANLSVDEFLADDCLGEVEILDYYYYDDDREKVTQMNRHDEEEEDDGDREKVTQMNRHDEEEEDDGDREKVTQMKRHEEEEEEEEEEKDEFLRTDQEEEEEDEEKEEFLRKDQVNSYLISMEAPPVSELALPASDREDEWISLFVYDTFSGIPAYGKPITMPPPPPPAPAAGAPVKSKRSKRRRPSSGSWSWSSSSLWVGGQHLYCVDSSTSSSSTATVTTTATAAAASSSVSTCSSSSTPLVSVFQLMFDETPPRKRPDNKPKKRGRKPKIPTATKESERGNGERRCSHCGVNKTPQWRTGPHGAKTLCNACGVRYKSGRLLPEYRPACSPTFVSHVHSNSHRKVLEMRLKKEDKHGTSTTNLRLVPSF